MYIIKLVANIGNKQSSRPVSRRSEEQATLFVGPTRKHANCESWLLNNGFTPCRGVGNSHWKRNGKARVREYENYSPVHNLRAEIVGLHELSAISVQK